MQGAGQGIQPPWPLIIIPWPGAENGGLDFRGLAGLGGGAGPEGAARRGAARKRAAGGAAGGAGRDQGGHPGQNDTDPPRPPEFRGNATGPIRRAGMRPVRNR